MGDKVLLRSEVDQKYTWDLTAMYVDSAAYQVELQVLKTIANEIEVEFKGELTDAVAINRCLDLYRVFQEKYNHLSSYGFLSVATDLTNVENQSRMENLTNLLAILDSKLSFVKAEIIANDDSVIEAAAAASAENSGYLKEVLRTKPHALSQQNERLLSALSPVLESPRTIYNKAKLADLDYEPLVVDGKTYPMGFVIYENVYDIERDTNKRRAAFELFSKNLRRYNHTVAAAYNTQLKKEKIIATARGFDSVIDYLLFEQKVDRDLYDRQIDVIMQELSAPMRKYAKLLKAQNGLDRVTFPDLKMAVDYDYEPQISIPEAFPYIKGALAVYGEEYSAMLDRALSERWIDFVNNKGKSSGAFCASPYGAHPYILISWSQRMREVFVLAHELGHAGHFYLAGKNQNVFDTRPSMYFIEAPSTMNELLMANYLSGQKPDDLRFRRWVLASMISRTYYHNFVTHLLEAHFQREVYQIIDAGGSVQAADLNRLKLATLQKFWGDAVEMTPGAELTWMRQQHYYKGLYPYTYSAGLTVATAVNQRILKEGQAAVEDWKNVLVAGGTKTPVELAAMAGVDITTDQPLKDTIAFIGDMIDEIVEITDKLNN